MDVPPSTSASRHAIPVLATPLNQSGTAEPWTGRRLTELRRCLGPHRIRSRARPAEGMACAVTADPSTPAGPVMSAVSATGECAPRRPSARGGRAPARTRGRRPARHRRARAAHRGRLRREDARRAGGASSPICPSRLQGAAGAGVAGCSAQLHGGRAAAARARHRVVHARPARAGLAGLAVLGWWFFAGLPAVGFGFASVAMPSATEAVVRSSCSLDRLLRPEVGEAAAGRAGVR